jgi:hypothetical protein
MHKREDAHAREIRRIDNEMTKLEDQLVLERRKVAVLTRSDDTPEPTLASDGLALIRAGHDGPGARVWLGAPILLRMSRRFNGALPRHRFDDVLEHLRAITQDPGQYELTPNAVVWASDAQPHPIQSQLMVRVIVTDVSKSQTTVPEDYGACFTTLTVTDQLGALAGRMFGAFGTMLGAGGLAAPVAASLAFPLFTPLFVVGWLGGVYGTTRLLYRRLAKARAQRLQAVFASLVELVEQYIEVRS